MIKLLHTGLVVLAWLISETLVNYLWQEKSYQNWAISSFQSLLTVVLALLAIASLWRIWRR